MKLTPGFAAISILMGMLGLAACGQNSNQVVYQYSETAVLFDNFHILKTVYTSGEMKLLREKTVRSAGSPNHRTTLAGPAPAERRTRESSAPSAADRFNLFGVNEL